MHGTLLRRPYMSDSRTAVHALVERPAGQSERDGEMRGAPSDAQLSGEHATLLDEGSACIMHHYLCRTGITSHQRSALVFVPTTQSTLAGGHCGTLIPQDAKKHAQQYTLRPINSHLYLVHAMLDLN